jgi:hypothetical protein
MVVTDYWAIWARASRDYAAEHCLQLRRGGEPQNSFNMRFNFLVLRN